MRQYKLFLVDLDGVVLHRADFFSRRAQTLYPDANHAAILEFFTGGTYKETALGKKDLPISLAKELPHWNVPVTVEELLKTWFDGENTIDEAVLKCVTKIRNSGITCVLATDHSSYRKHDVWENVGMKHYFDDIIASADVGATKEDPAFYRYALERFNINNLETVLFTDDDSENVAVANSLGITGIVFTGVDIFKNIK